MAYIKTLFTKNFNNINSENSDTQIYPVTITDAVFNRDNENLENILKEYKEKIENLENKINTEYVRILPVDEIVASADITQASIVPDEGTKGTVVWVVEESMFAYKYKDIYYNWGPGMDLYINTEVYPFRPQYDKFYMYNNSIYTILNGDFTCINGTQQ